MWDVEYVRSVPVVNFSPVHPELVTLSPAGGNTCDARISASSTFNVRAALEQTQQEIFFIIFSHDYAS